MELYQITYNDDGDTGAGRTIFMNLYFTTKAAAQSYIESKYYADRYGVQGLKGNSRDIKTVKKEDIEPKIYSGISDYESRTGICVDLTAQQNKDRDIESMSREELIKIIKDLNKKGKM